MNHPQAEFVLVEDNPHEAELIERVLRKHNLANGLVLLKDGAAALDFFFDQGAYAHGGSKFTLKVVLLDLKLPKVSGIEVLRRMKSNELTRRIPVVVLTSSTEERDIEEAYALGVNSYVAKPIEFAELSEIVSKLGQYWLALNKPPENR
jgi:two-component system, response regulator